MVVWTDNAISHITEFINSSKNDTEAVSKAYMEKLINYADMLDTMHHLGKKMDYTIFEYELNQLIYKEHRIIYHIKENNVVILAVIHIRLDLDKAISRLKRGIS